MNGPNGCFVLVPEIGSRMGCAPLPAGRPPVGAGPSIVTPSAAPAPTPTAVTPTQVQEVHPAAQVDLLGLAPWIAAVALGILALVLLVLLLRARREAAAATIAAQPRPVDLEGLAQELIALADLAGSPSVSAQAGRALRRIGLEPVEVVAGAQFDPDRHVVASTEPTDDPARVRRVAGQMRPGWRRGSKLVRPADVRLWVGA